MCRDAIDGEDAIKRGGPTYLPIPPAMQSGTRELSPDLKKDYSWAPQGYHFYMTMASFPEIVSPMIDVFQGIIHTNPPHLALPPAMESLNEENKLVSMWQKITREILSVGRIPVVLDINPDDNLVYPVMFSAESLINWGENFAVLTEYVNVPDSDRFDPRQELNYLVYEMMQDGFVFVSRYNEKRQIVSSGPISLRGRSFFQALPVFPLGVSGMDWKVGPIPVISMVRRALEIYRLNADYRRALYIKCDPQPVITGVTNDNEIPNRIGGNTVWTFTSPEAKAYYLDIDGQGIPILRMAIEDEYTRFWREGGRLLESSSAPVESGLALRLRQMAQQVSLRSLALCAGQALNQILNVIATGLNVPVDPKQPFFVADIDFSEPRLTGQELREIMEAVTMGAPLALETVHERARRGGLTKETFEGELALAGGQFLQPKSQQEVNDGTTEDGRGVAGTAEQGD
jgi:hypothetical protein